MAEWTREQVAARLQDAAQTAYGLPSARVQGYFSVWPALAREAWATLGRDDDEPRPPPPGPAAEARMLEVSRWLLWLTAEQRHLLWLRARGFEWADIGRQLACDRNTAWRRWQRALDQLAARLNGDLAEPA